MYPITAIVTALALGASEGLKSTATRTIKDSYSDLKNIIQKKYTAASHSLEALEKATDSIHKRNSLQEDLAKTNVLQDTQVLEQVQALLAALKDQAPQAAQVIGIKLEDIETANVRLRDISASGTNAIGVHLKDVKAEHDIDITSVNVKVCKEEMFVSERTFSDGCIVLREVNAGENITVIQNQYNEYNKVDADARSYWERKLEAIKDFLVDPLNPNEDKSRKHINVRELKEHLKNSEEYGEFKFKEPQRIKVRGTLFPAALLTAGWWERVKEKDNVTNFWRNDLQKWLFEGFDVWAPSWDISWELDDFNQSNKPYYVAQLTDGDEADSLIVIIPPKLAMEWKEKFIKGWGGCEVEITGILGHRSQVRNQLPQGNVLWEQAEDYCIWLKDDDNQYKIEKLNDKTELYSGYLWQCWIPRKWWEESDSIGLKDVYIVWEHTNFAAKDAYNYNLSSLRDKVSYIEKTDGELILLQKSHGLLAPGDPLWPIEDFYKILTNKEVEK